MIIYLGIACGIELLVIIALIICLIKVKTNKKIVKEKDGVRYTVSDKVEDENGPIASFVKGDVILAADEVYTVNKNGPIKPGRYNILSTQDKYSSVNLKINGIARGQKHNSAVVFAEGDIVIAQNTSAILR